MFHPVCQHMPGFFFHNTGVTDAQPVPVSALARARAHTISTHRKQECPW
jgi:hypothetical protein